MNTLLDTEWKACANGCTDKGSDTPRIAKHGNFCGKEWGRARAALKIVPELMEHMVSLKASSAQADEKVDGSRTPPAPGNEQAMNDTHETYRRLVYWSALWAKQMGITAPGPAIGAWRDGQGHVVGLPGNVSPSGAKLVTKMMTRWLDANLESIFHLSIDDVNYWLDDLKDVFRLNARWPREAVPRYSDMPCPRQGCAGRIAVFPPVAFLEDERIVCERCGTWYPPTEYEHLILVFKQIREEEKTGKRVGDHLVRKFVVGGS